MLSEREIKPAQNVVTNPFKCGRGSLRCEPVHTEVKGESLRYVRKAKTDLVECV